MTRQLPLVLDEAKKSYRIGYSFRQDPNFEQALVILSDTLRTTD